MPTAGDSRTIPLAWSVKKSSRARLSTGSLQRAKAKARASRVPTRGKRAAVALPGCDLVADQRCQVLS